MLTELPRDCGTEMSSKQDESIVTVLTCEGNISDPDFPYKLSSLVTRLRRLLLAGDKPFRVTNVEPWNSVRVTFNIPREAAQRLRQLAQAANHVLRDLGILSVQIEGDQVISLTIAGHFNESQEILLQTSQEDRLRPVPSSSFDMIGLETSQPPSSVETTRKNIAQYLSQQGGSASTSLSSAPVVPPDGLFSSSLTSDVDFKSPNVVAPGSEPIPFPPKVSPLPTTRNPTPYGPFPFASMTHAMNTMHGSHHSTSTLPQSSSPNRFPFSPPPPYPTSTSHSGAFQPIRPSYSPASGAVSLSSSVASGTATISTPPATTSSSLSRTCDRPNAALNSPLLVNLLQSDMSNGPSSQHLSGKALAPPPLLSDVSVGSAAGQKRKRRTGQLKKKLPTENSTTTSPSTSPLTSPSLCPFSQPFGITMPTVSSIPLSPPSLTPPSASPPSLIGQPCTSTEAMPTLKPIPFTNQPLHHGVPPLPSPPPTAPSSSASTSNNSGQSSQEAEHELSPWPSPSKRTQHLINPITGQLEPMSSEDEEDDKTSMDCSPSIDQCLNMVSDNSSSSLQSSPFVDTSRASECLLTAVQRPSAECMEGVSGDMKVTGPSSSVSKEVSSSGWSAPSPPAVVATAPSRDSPSEKIKLRLKLDPKPRIEKDKESGKPGEKPKSEGGAVTGLQYKVDVSFVNIPTRKVSSSSACSVIGFPPVTSGSSSSIVTVGCAVNSSNMPTTGTTNSGSCTIAEPRVPPLHISLRGRNAAVVTNPRREERERTRKSPESPFVKVQRSRVPRSSRTEESRTIVSGGSETGRSPPTPAGRRGAVSRGGSNSRRGRCSSYADAALPAADVGVVSSHHGTLSEGRTMVASPPSALQPSAGREKTLLSGGSFVLESTGSLAGGSVSSQPMPLTNSVADKHVTNMPTTTVVSSVHIPRLEVESGTDSSLPVENSPSSVTPETLDNSNEKALMISENHPAKITRLPSKRSSSKEWESTPSQRTLQWQALEDNLAVSDDKGVLTHSKNDPVKTSTASSQHLNSVLGHHTIAAASELNALLDKPITPPSIQFRRSSRDGSRGDDLLGSVVVKGVKVMSLSEGARAIVERRESFTRLLSGASSATKTSVALSSPPSSVTVTTVTSSSSSSLSRGFSVAAALDEKIHTSTALTPNPSDSTKESSICEHKLDPPSISAIAPVRSKSVLTNQKVVELRPLSLSGAVNIDVSQAVTQGQSLLNSLMSAKLKEKSTPHSAQPLMPSSVTTVKSISKPLVSAVAAKVATLTDKSETPNSAGQFESVVNNKQSASSHLQYVREGCRPSTEQLTVCKDKSPRSLALAGEMTSNVDSIAREGSAKETKCVVRPNLPPGLNLPKTLEAENSGVAASAVDGVPPLSDTEPSKEVPAVSKERISIANNKLSEVVVPNRVMEISHADKVMDVMSVVATDAKTPNHRILNSKLTDSFVSTVALSVTDDQKVPLTHEVLPPHIAKLPCKSKLSVGGLASTISPSGISQLTPSHGKDALVNDLKCSKQVDRLNDEDPEVETEFGSNDTIEHQHHLVSSTVCSTSMSIMTISASPCSASPSGSSPDSLNIGMSSEEASDRVHGERRNRHHPLGSHCNSSGSPYEDSGIESMDAIMEKLSGEDSPSDKTEYSSAGSSCHNLPTSRHGYALLTSDFRETENGRSTSEVSKIQSEPMVVDNEPSTVANIEENKSSDVVNDVPSTAVTEYACSNVADSLLTTVATSFSALPSETDIEPVVPHQDSAAPPNSSEEQDTSQEIVDGELIRNETLTDSENKSKDCLESDVSAHSNSPVPKLIEASVLESQGCRTDGESLALIVAVQRAESTDVQKVVSSSPQLEPHQSNSVFCIKEDKASPVHLDWDPSLPEFVYELHTIAAEEKEVAGCSSQDMCDVREERCVDAESVLENCEGETSLLTSVVFQEDSDSDEHIRVMAAQEAGNLRDVLSCDSPSETTQLLVFTVQDVDSIMMGENSDPEMSLLQVESTGEGGERSEDGSSELSENVPTKDLDVDRESGICRHPNGELASVAIHKSGTPETDHAVVETSLKDSEEITVMQVELSTLTTVKTEGMVSDGKNLKAGEELALTDLRSAVESSSIKQMLIAESTSQEKESCETALVTGKLASGAVALSSHIQPAGESPQHSLTTASLTPLKTTICTDVMPVTHLNSMVVSPPNRSVAVPIRVLTLPATLKSQLLGPENGGFPLPHPALSPVQVVVSSQASHTGCSAPTVTLAAVVVKSPVSPLSGTNVLAPTSGTSKALSVAPTATILPLNTFSCVSANSALAAVGSSSSSSSSLKHCDLVSSPSKPVGPVEPNTIENTVGVTRSSGLSESLTPAPCFNVVECLKEESPFTDGDPSSSLCSNVLSVLVPNATSRITEPLQSKSLISLSAGSRWESQNVATCLEGTGVELAVSTVVAKRKQSVDSDADTDSSSGSTVGECDHQRRSFESVRDDGSCSKDVEDLYIGNASITSGDHNYIFRASRMATRENEQDKERDKANKRMTLSDINDTNAFSDHGSTNVSSVGTSSPSGDEAGRQLTIEAPLENEVEETERRSTRSTCSDLRESNPNADSKEEMSQQLTTDDVSCVANSSFPHVSHPTCDGIVSSDNEREACELPSHTKCLQDDSDSGSDKCESNQENACDPEKDGVPPSPSDLDLSKETIDYSIEYQGFNAHVYSKPVKRKCSENAVELIKACIGFEDNPKKPTVAKQPHQQLTNEPGRMTASKNMKNREDGSKLKVRSNLLVDDITEESSDDEVTLSELVTKARSGKVKQAGNLSAEDRNVTRSAKLRHSVKEDDLSSSPRTEKANSRVSNRREDGKSGRVVGIQRESRKEERTSSRLSGRLSERGRPLARGQEQSPQRTNHRSKTREHDRAVSPLGISREEGEGGKRKLRSSGASGYYDSLPQKRRRLSREHR